MAEYDLFPRALSERYDPLRVLGRGGMGSVFEAEDRNLRRRVAIKVLSEGADLLRNGDRFQAEAWALARISHPSVVAVHDAGFADSAPYLVMELLDGSDLSDLVAGQLPLPAPTAMRIAHEVLSGLQAAHEQDVMHRDVKPANVRVTERGRVVLYDFGLARIAEERAITAPGDLLGTPRYMAPERIRGLPPLPTTDVYGVGACLHVMLTGRQPFGEALDVGVLVLRAAEGLPPLGAQAPTLPPGLVAAVDALCARDPADRPQTAAEAAALVLPWAGEPLALTGPFTQRTMALGSRAPARDPLVPAPPVGLPGLRTAPSPEYDWVTVDVGRTGDGPESPELPVLSESTTSLFRSRLTDRTATARQREAVALALRGSFREASEMLAGVLPFCQESLGAAHPTTLACQFWQAVCLARLGAARPALELFSHVTTHTGPGRDTTDA
ncbi:hypothetical protein DEJ50_27595 [Streptomyces venezuelae]|uniref:non-specific serine/threonine protein kinase n=1 Tax=Streptomyces venezuelae TaxID=54571 RepID=A0A5P2D7K8_STRVZ|nr:serine/threonine-protein kinase [Streptomyces venezuelae]QES51036.1 hypothetical protein DEJ50_27595 [Streptomyces venezuelae]